MKLSMTKPFWHLLTLEIDKMNDGVMPTWSVVSYDYESSDVLYVCANKGVAEYLRDWCEAEEINNGENLYYNAYQVEESEVIL